MDGTWCLIYYDLDFNKDAEGKHVIIIFQQTVSCLFKQD